MAISDLASSWLLVISSTICFLLGFLYLFYFNRILAYFVACLLRINWWDEEEGGAWVSLEAVQFSLLAGHISIKDFKYHGSCQSIRAVKCKITWRYWLWQPRSTLVATANDEGERKGSLKSSKSPSRIHIAVEGAEWRLYNRTAAYDAVLSKIKSSDGNINVNEPSQTDSAAAINGDGVPAAGSKSATSANIASEDRYVFQPHGPVGSIISVLKARFKTWFKSAFQPEFHELLPIDFDVLRGAFVLGNSSTPSLLVASFSKASGSYGIVPSRSPLDDHKTVVEVNFHDVKLDLERNHDHHGPMVFQGRAAVRRLTPLFSLESLLSHLPFTKFHNLWNTEVHSQVEDKVNDAYARLQAEQETEQRNDYAIAESILETPRLELSYFWDTPGKVPFSVEKHTSEGLEPRIGNGDLAPEYGLNLIIYGGTVRYGPWADRQRYELQRLFFPPAFQSASPTAVLRPGDTRIYTSFKVFVELQDATTFHIPFREPSKNWQFDEKKIPGSSRKRREAGWLEVHAGGNSTINYVMPWVATETGYDTLMEMHFDEVSVLTSVNDIRLLYAKSSRIHCGLPTPLKWNDFRHWTFDISLRSSSFHIIRDHINLFTDLGKDWNSGPPSDFDRWVPMCYTANVVLHGFEITMYLNDQNLITNPHAHEANTFLTLNGNNLQSSAEIPSNIFRPQYTTVPFWIQTSDIDLTLTVPRWNTHAAFASSRVTNFGRVGFLRIDASFMYFSETRPDYIDRLRLDIFGRDVAFIALGWIIRHLMITRENYFGNFTHFSTLYEYVSKRNSGLPLGDPVELKWVEGKSNTFEVCMEVIVEQSVVVLPAGFQGYEASNDIFLEGEEEPTIDPKCIGTAVIFLQPELQVALRTHEYSMEMSLNISPATLSVVQNLKHMPVFEQYANLDGQRLQIDGVNIVAHRLFGPQPRTSTYLCLWEMDIGGILGLITTTELQGLAAALSSFRFNFLDAVNAPAEEFAVKPEPDVTFLKLVVRSVDVAWSVGKTNIEAVLPKGVCLDYNDLAGKTYKKVTEIRVPKAILRALCLADLKRELWLEAASVSFDMALDVYTAPEGWKGMAKVQTDFVATQDAPTRRAWFLYEKMPSGPGLAYHGNIFLAKPRLPGRPSQTPTPRKQNVNLSTKSQFTRLAAVESDEDEKISEADRDARLAHSRPGTPVVTNKSDGDSSSFDESDDTEISDHDVSDSDSDVAGDVGRENRSQMDPILSHYRSIVRRFESRERDRLLHGVLFGLIKDLSLPTEKPHFDGGTKLLSCSNKKATALETDSKDDLNTVTRILKSNHIEVLLTPLCLPLLREMVSSVNASVMSVELQVDAMTKKYLGDNFSKKISRSKTVLDMNISTLQLRILQSLMAADEVLLPLLPTGLSPPSLSLRNSRVVSDFVFNVSNVSIALTKVSHGEQISLTVDGHLSGFYAYLDISTLHALSQMNRTLQSKRQFQVTFQESRCIFASTNFRATLGALNLQFFGNSSSEMVAATIDNLLRVSEATRIVLAGRYGGNNRGRQQQVWSILHSCQHISIEDPIAQIQPSFLIQSGRPLTIRRDPSWKLFMYLRHCLRWLLSSHRKHLASLPYSKDTAFSSLDPKRVTELVRERLVEWNFEFSDDEIVELPFLHHSGLLPRKGESTKPLSYARLPTMSVSAAPISIVVSDSFSSSSIAMDNTFRLGPISFTHKERNMETTVSAIRLPNVPATTLLPDPKKASTRHRVTSILMGGVQLTIYPSFIIFLQKLLPLHGKYFHNPNETAGSPKKSSIVDNIYWDIFFDLQTVSLQAAVEGMVAEIGLRDLRILTPILHGTTQARPKPFTSANGFIKISQLWSQVRQAQDKTNPFLEHDRDTLARIAWDVLTMHTTYRIEGDASPVVQGTISMDSIVISVPRSALLTYQLVEEWRTQYLPKIHTMTHNFILEINKRNKSSSPRPISPITHLGPSPVIDFHVATKRAGLLLQVMHGTWLAWDIHDIIVYSRRLSSSVRHPGFIFGVQLAGQWIEIGERSNVAAGQKKTVKVALPAFRASGAYDGVQLKSHAVIDQFSLTIKPTYMDDILAVQQNLGSHFDDLLDLIAQNRAKRVNPKSSNKPPMSLKYDVAFMLRGFRIGIAGPTTRLDLTSVEMTGTARNEPGLAWNFAVSNLALALSHRLVDTRPHGEFDRNLRSAYMVLDVKASSHPYSSTSADEKDLQDLHLQIGHMHAVMSPNSIGELGDLIDHIQAEKLLRQEQRAQELEEMKQKTKRVIRVFDVQKPRVPLKRSASFLDNCTLQIDVANIGIAFPLELNDEIEVDALGAVPAFLMSIKKASLFTKRSETAQASVGSLSFQFVKLFDQSIPGQFDGDLHSSRNKLLYPGMKASFRYRHSSNSRQWQLSTSVDGFNLDLDPAIVDYVFGLLEVYRRGKERIEKITLSQQGNKILPAIPSNTPSIEPSYQAIRTSNLLLTLIFKSGKLRLRSSEDSEHSSYRAASSAGTDISEIIHFPTITVWGEYRATSAAAKISGSQHEEPAVVIFRSQIHSTRNRIQPSIFPFLLGFSSRIEDQMRRSKTKIYRMQDSSSSDISSISDSTTERPRELLSPGVLGGIQVSFSLRIDASTLELTCGQELNVLSAVHWDSGGFVLTLSPLQRSANLAGSVKGLDVDLRPSRLQPGTLKTAHINARNLVFSASYTHHGYSNDEPLHAISVVVDTEFGAIFRLDRLQDLLVFKAVYMDRLPGSSPQSRKSEQRGTNKPSIPGLKTMILFRARHINLQADLGHNVAFAVFDMNNLVIRSRLLESLTDFTVNIQHIKLNLKEDRPLAGYLRLPEFSFTTTREACIRPYQKNATTQMLDVRMGSGALDLVLQSERRILFQYRAEPFDVRISDDWSAIHRNLPPEERTLHLDFSVVGTEVLAIANLLSIPRLIMLFGRMRNDVQFQKAEARRHLTLSAVELLPKPQNPLTEVVDAMIRSTRSRLTQEPIFSFTIMQRMTLRLSNLRLALFKMPNDSEVALFQGKDVHAELERIVHAVEDPPTRNLKLAFSSLYLSKYSALRYRQMDDLSAIPWLEKLLKGANEWTIARVPAMNLEMNSDVEYDGPQETLHFDLVATPDEQYQSASSIYVSLNLSLYIWAGALVKGLGLEIDKTLTTSGFERPVARAVPSIATSGSEREKSDGGETAPPGKSSPTHAPLHDGAKVPRLPRKYHARSETHIDYGTIQQLGEATPDAQAPWLGLKETVPPRVHEYATLPMEALMKVLLEVYIKQLKAVRGKTWDNSRGADPEAPLETPQGYHTRDVSALD